MFGKYTSKWTFGWAHTGSSLQKGTDLFKKEA